MKEALPLRAVGFGLCLVLPLIFLLNFYASPVRGSLNSVLLSVVLAEVALGLLLAGLWGIGFSLWDWKHISENEREEFLRREQMTQVQRYKSAGALLLFLLLLSGLVAPLFYVVHSLWQPLSVSWVVFTAVSVVSYSCSALILIGWLALCDWKIRLSRRVNA